MPRSFDADLTRRTLAAVPFLSGLPGSALERLASRSIERAATKGAILFREGEPCTGFWIVATGSANVVKASPDGRIQILETCPRGAVVALVSALDGGAYPATVQAREDSTLLVFPTPLIRETVLQHPEVGLGIARHLAGRLRRSTCRSASVCLRSVRSRVASFLLESIAGRAPDERHESAVLVLGASQEELAHRLGTVREVLARTLRSFREENLIAQRGDTITVLDVARLEGVAES